MSRARIRSQRDAGDGYAVSTLDRDPCGAFVHRREPCEQCPWRRDVPTGVFPAEAYRLSARTAHDAGLHTFACHMSGAERPAVCAGFLIANSDNNLAVRMAMAMGRFDHDAVSSTAPLYGSYREMAIANGVPPDDEALDGCRGNHDGRE